MPRSNYDPILELACPHDGWYNGNPKLMIINGTFADYRYRLVEWVNQGKMDPRSLQKFDQEWAAIPMEEKIRRRNAVIAATEPKPTKLEDGSIELRSSPSDNGAAKIQAPKFRKKLVARQAPGALANRPNPLLSGAVQGQGQAPAGSPVPMNVRPPAAPSLASQMSPAATAV